MKTLRSFEIVDYLKEKKYCSVNQLMEHFKVSPATIHRDIAELTKKKLIQKVHGGVALAAKPEPKALEPVNSHFSSRIVKNPGEKLKIAEKALSLIEDGDIIFLDSSTTALHFARKIQKLDLSNLTVITNSVLIIQEFHLFPRNFFLLSLGGNYNYQLNSFLGKTTIEHLKSLKVNKAFISSFGITEKGITTYHEDHCEFLKDVIETSRKIFLLEDSSKFEKDGLFDICTLDKISAMVCDKKPSADICSQILLSLTNSK